MADVDQEGEEEGWPEVNFNSLNQTLNEFAKVETQVEILRKRVTKHAMLIKDLRDTKVISSQPATGDVGKPFIDENVGDKLKELEKRMTEYDAVIENNNSRVDNCDYESKNTKSDLLTLKNRVAELEELLAVVINENKTAIVELRNGVNNGLGLRIDHLEKQKIDTDAKLAHLEEAFAVLKTEALGFQQATKEYEEKMEHKVHKASVLIQKLEDKLYEMENSVYTQGKKTATLEHEIERIKQVTNSDHEKVKHLEVGKANVEELDKKADKHDVQLKAEVDRVTELEEALLVLKKRVSYTESSLKEELERSEKSTDKRLDGVLSSMMKLVRREIKKMMNDFQGIADIGKAGVARNRCLVCDQPVKMQTRESPAQLPRETNHMPVLHVTHIPKQRNSKPDIRHESSPPRVHLDKEILDSLANSNQMKDYAGIFGPPIVDSRPTISEPDPGLITQIPSVKRSRPKTAGVNRSSSEKTIQGIEPPRGVVYDTNQFQEYEREYISTVVAGKQVNVGDVLSVHSNTARLFDGVSDKEGKKSHSMAGDLMGWKTGRPASAPAKRKPGVVVAPTKAQC